VLKLHGPVRPLTADKVLARLRGASVTESASIAELGRSWGWKRERASKALVRWQEAGHIGRENRLDGAIVIRWRDAVHGDGPRENTGRAAGPTSDDAATGFTASFGGVHAGNPAGNFAGKSVDDPAFSALREVSPIMEEVIDVPAPVKQPDCMAATMAEPFVEKPAVPMEWRIVERPVWHPTVIWQAPSAADAARAAQPEYPSHGVPAWWLWSLGVVSIGLSVALYGAGVLLNSTFWPSLATSEKNMAILAVVGFVIETSNYTIPTIVSIASMMSRARKIGLSGFWILTMTAGAVASASFVRSNFGAAEVSRNQTIKERSRLEYGVSKPMDPVSDAAVVDARKRVETAKAVAKADCAPVKTKDIDQCNRSRAALGQAEADLRNANAKHGADVKLAEQRYREDHEKAQADLKALPVISADRNVVLAGVAAIMPWASEAWVNGIVAGLWVALFGFGPCILLRGGLALRDEKVK